jgi:hypothetical protein
VIWRGDWRPTTNKEDRDNIQVEKEEEQEEECRK